MDELITDQQLAEAGVKLKIYPYEGVSLLPLAKRLLQFLKAERRRAAKLEVERDKWIKKSGENWACAVRRKTSIAQLKEQMEKNHG